jgi:hypothetical protein
MIVLGMGEELVNDPTINVSTTFKDISLLW